MLRWAGFEDMYNWPVFRSLDSSSYGQVGLRMRDQTRPKIAKRIAQRAGLYDLPLLNDSPFHCHLPGYAPEVSVADFQPHDGAQCSSDYDGEYVITLNGRQVYSHSLPNCVADDRMIAVQVPLPGERWKPYGTDCPIVSTAADKPEWCWPGSTLDK